MLQFKHLVLTLLVAQSTLPSLATLHTTQEINSFLYSTNEGICTTFCLTGLVEHIYNRAINTPILISDNTGSQTFFARVSPVLTQGAYGVASGRVSIDHSHEPFVWLSNFKVLGQRPIPPPIKIKLGDLSPSMHDFRRVETEGSIAEVIDDDLDPNYVLLMLRDSGVTIPLPLKHDDLPAGKLLGARIRVSGVYKRAISGTRKFTGPYIEMDSPPNITLLNTATSDYSNLPKLETRYYLTPIEIASLDRRRICGRVIATWDNAMMLQADDSRIINVYLAHGIGLPKCHSRILVAGFPETDLYRINLTGADWCPLPDSTVPPDVPQDTTPAEILGLEHGRKRVKADCHGRLVRLCGVVRSLPSAPFPRHDILIETDGETVTIDATAYPQAIKTLKLDMTVEVTGRCRLDISHWTPSNIFPVIKGFTVLPDRPDWVRILKRPSWWTPGKLLTAIGFLALALLSVILRNHALRRMASLRLSERTRLAVELHDSLSQNLSAIACQVAATRGTLGSSPLAIAKQLETVEKMLQSSRTELKRCLWDLRSDALGERSFNKAILKALGVLTAQTAIQIRFNLHRNLFNDTDAQAILSIIRELVSNAIAHGKAKTVRIAGDFTDGIFAFSVRDDGLGFDPNLTPGLSEGHFGLQGIRERIKKLKGELAIESTPGGPTRITVRINRK